MCCNPFRDIDALPGGALLSIDPWRGDFLLSFYGIRVVLAVRLYLLPFERTRIEEAALDDSSSAFGLRSARIYHLAVRYVLGTEPSRNRATMNLEKRDGDFSDSHECLSAPVFPTGSLPAQ